MISREKALEILYEHTKNENLGRHALAVEAAMEGLAKYFNVPQDDVREWKIVGLLHDADYEETKNDVANHGMQTVEWLKSAGETDNEIMDAIAAHNYSHNGASAPSSNMAWSVYCCDELTGFIVAVALVRPDKKLSSVTVDAILKKLDEKSFAAAVDREQIKMCEEKLGIPLPEFVKITLESMQNISDQLGL